ncbi:unnamed protein product [Arctia plantaginis]|uniref:Peptidase M14 domain-containing protein n=1 Tax=Arctia plantaginis TaxID=874455 RepID=A0A8S0Z8N7_ARCPL|nr:unnamed protein product [Arctia plantaginis]
MEGDKYEMNKIMKHLRDNYELPYHGSNGNKCQMLVAPELVPVVETMAKIGKVSTKVVIEDYSEIIKMEKANPLRIKSFSWNAYYDIDDIYGYLQNMSQLYPETAQVVVGGRSYEGRDILGLRIKSPTRNVKPTMFIESGIHAREWITPAATTYFINELLTSKDPKIQRLRNEFDWHIFPSVNPDGYHYSYTKDRMWRKTRSKSSARCYGADPNRNWDYNWQNYGTSKNPCDYQTYGGSKPFSEIETRSLSEYISKLDNLKGYVAFHSDAQMLLLPYSDSTEHDQYYDSLKIIGQTSLDYGFQVNKAKYMGPGTAAELLYQASGGSMDWVHQTVGIPLAFTYELRGLYFYWPPKRISEQGNEVTQMMLGLITEAANLGFY